MPRSSGTYPRPSAHRLWGGSFVMSRPSSSMRPDVGLCSPMRQRRSVVLPAPLRPTRVTTSPSSTSRETPCSTWASPYPAVSSWILSNVLPQVGGDHARVVADLLVRALGQRLPKLQHRYPLVQFANDLHVVLHQHDRASGAHPPDQLD